MKENRRIAVTVGILYIIGTFGGIMSIIFTGAVRGAQDLLIAVTTNENQIVLGAFFIMLMWLSLAMIPVLMFPILKKYNETLAVGYIVFRSGFESIGYLVVVISLLFLLPLSEAYTRAGSKDTYGLEVIGNILLDAKMISPVSTIVFCLGAFMFYTVLYQSRLVPRWLSGWGLVAILPYVASGFLVMFSIIDPLSTIGVISNLPLALQEMVLAGWLIVKGFKTDMFEGTSEI